MAATSQQDKHKGHRGDSDESKHSACIQAVARALNEGVALHVSRKCTICAKECKQIISLNDGDKCFAEGTQEYGAMRDRMGFPRFDLFIMHVDNTIFGIELFVTHSTDPWDRSRAQYDWIELGSDNTDDMLEQLSVAHVKKDVYAVHVTDERRICCQCIVRDDIQPAQVIVRQFGAGGGKTYSLFADIGNLIRDSDKRVFIFVSKTHSAIGTMQHESEIQLYERRDDSAHNFDFADADINAQKNTFKKMYKGVVKMHPSKTVITRHHATVACADGAMMREHLPFVCVFMTIDSLIYAIHEQLFAREALPVCADQFMERIDRVLDIAIIEPTRVTLHPWLSNIRTHQYDLGDKCTSSEYLPLEYAGLFDESRVHIFVDESQDLNARYVAVLGALAYRGVSLTIVGDAMQAVYDTTWIGNSKMRAQVGHAMELDENGRSRLQQWFPRIFARDIIVEQSNKTWRCRRAEWAHMINVLSGSAYMRASVQPAQNPDRTCSGSGPIIDVFAYYGFSPENKPALLREILEKYVGDFPACKQYELIMPFIKNTGHATQLHDVAQEFWESRANTTRHESYVMYHASHEGQPIRLDESKDIMRIMSIHASKGTGREVIIWWDADDASLTHFDKMSYRSRSLSISQCLRYVALTRHKCRLAIVCFKPSQILHDVVKLREESSHEKLVSMHVSNGCDEIDITAMVRSITTRATFKRSSVVYPKTRNTIASMWCDIGKPYHWVNVCCAFNGERTQSMTGIDMTDITILRMLLSARCSFDCARFGPRYRGGDPAFYSINAICHQLGNSDRPMVTKKPRVYGDMTSMWIEVDAISKGEMNNSETSQLTIPAYTHLFNSLITRRFRAGLRDFARAAYRAITGEVRASNACLSAPSATYATQIVNEETLGYLAMIYYIHEQRCMRGYSTWSEWAITRTLRAINDARASSTSKCERCGDLSELSRNLIEPITRQMLRIVRRDGRTDIELFANIYELSRIYICDRICKYDYTCVKDAGFVVYDHTTKTFYLTLYEPKITELNHINLVAESLLTLRCMYINSIAYDPEHGYARDDRMEKCDTILKWMTFMREARTYAIRYITLNIAPDNDEIILIPDDDVTRIIRDRSCPFDEDIMHISDDQITNIFTQIAVCSSFLRGSSESRKSASYKDMIARLTTGSPVNRHANSIESKICELIDKYDGKIFDAFMRISIRTLDEIRDKVKQEMYDIWRAQLELYITPCASTTYIEEDEDESSHH